MITYDTLLIELEEAWTSAQLHEHELIEHIQPETQNRTFRVELFPEHPTPLEEDKIPPWVEVSVAWTAFHRLRSEGYAINLSEQPLELTWVYNVLVPPSFHQYPDHELVRLFQRGIHAALVSTFSQEDDIPIPPVAVEVRRVYHSNDNQLSIAYVQLVSPNVTDISGQFGESDSVETSELFYNEFSLASALIHSLAAIFLLDIPTQGGNSSSGNSSYRTVDTA